MAVPGCAMIENSAFGFGAHKIFEAQNLETRANKERKPPTPNLLSKTAA
jgi:hypothetical protein